MNQTELEKIWASAPVDKFEFEVLKLYAPWFSKAYYVQYAIEHEPYVDLVIDGVETEVMFAPVRATRNTTNEDLAFDRSFSIEMVNDILALEGAKFDPDVHNKQDFKVTTWYFVSYEDGTFAQSSTGQVLNVNSAPRDTVGTTFNVSTKPTNATATGEINSNTRFPMQRGF